MKKKVTKYIVAIITGLAMFAFIFTLQKAVFGAPAVILDEPNIEVAAATVSTPRGFVKPAKLIIPSVSINAKVQHVGLTARGEMGIPTNFTDVAWYKAGTIPGEVGSAVIDGHVDNGLGLNGVFKKLNLIKIGDDVSVVDANGKTAHFRVTDIHTYPYKDVPTEEIFGATDKTLLRLITCGGKWVRSAKTYDTRVVVTAEYVEQQ